MVELSELSAHSRIFLALEILRCARDYLKTVECPNTLARVRSAIESCEGALRNQSARDADPTRKRVKMAKRRNLHQYRQASVIDAAALVIASGGEVRLPDLSTPGWL